MRRSVSGESGVRFCRVPLKIEGQDRNGLDRMAGRLLARPLRPEERVIVERTLQEMEAFYQQQPEAAKEMLSAGESKPSDKLPAPQLAALTMVANQLMNLDEVLNK